MIRLFVIALLAATALSLTSVRYASIEDAGIFVGTSGNFKMRAAVGDFDGDGFADLAMADSTQREVTVLYGPVAPTSTTLPPTTSIDGFGSTPLTTITAAFGDLDSDGIDDLVITAGSMVYLMKGSATRPADLTATTDSARIISVPGTSVALSTAVLNLNNDNNKDIAIVADTTVYVVLDALADDTQLDLTDEHVNVCRLQVAGEKSLAVGNLNGDSMDDLLIGVPDEMYVGVIYGHATPVCANNTQGLTDFLATSGAGFRFTSTLPTFGSGVDVANFNSAAGSDVVIGVKGALKAFVMSGPFSGATDIAVTPINAVVIEANSSHVNFGFSVRTVGDINHDSKDDVAIVSDGPTVGTVFVVHGFDVAAAGPVQLLDLEGLSIEGAFSNEMPLMLPFPRNVGDFNGDGSLDVFIGGGRSRVAVIWGGQCPVDHYLSGSDCVPCDPQCSTCIWNTGKCVLCPEHHWTDDKTCTTCDRGCAVGQCDYDAHECLQCSSPTHWPEDHRCVTCDVGCVPSTCLGLNQTCQECMRGYEMGDLHQCVPCGNLTYSNGTECVPCIPTCMGCFADSGRCFLCNDTSKVVDGRCQQCGPGQRSEPPGKECVGCKLGFGCLECNQLGDCTKCPAGKHIDGDRCRDCKDGEWNPEGSAACKKCTTSAPCFGCDPLTGDCTGCPPHYGWSKTGCAQCGADEYSDGKSPCVSCQKGEKCATCDPRTGLCTSCPDEYGIWGKGCTPCLKGTEFKNEVGHCQDCELGGGCLTCEMTMGNCTKCPDGKIPVGTGCVALPSSTESVTSVIVESAASMVSTLSALLLAAFVALLL